MYRFVFEHHVNETILSVSFCFLSLSVFIQSIHTVVYRRRLFFITELFFWKWIFSNYLFILFLDKHFIFCFRYYEQCHPGHSLHES